MPDSAILPLAEVGVFETPRLRSSRPRISNPVQLPDSATLPTCCHTYVYSI
jgi:hypothetical protein